MIRFSAALVAVAIGVLIGGIATSKLLLVYIAIAVSAVALLALAIGVVAKREELFGEGQGLVPAGAGTAPALSARAGESQDQLRPATSGSPSAQFQAPVAGYGAFDGTAFDGSAFGGTAQAAPPVTTPAPSTAGASAPSQAPDAPGRSRVADPVPTWETQSARDQWSSSPWPGSATAVGPAPDWMPSGQAASDPVGQAAPSPSPSVSPQPPAPSDAPGAAPEPVMPNWFAPLARTAETAPPATEAPADTAPADEDDDWPTRYSWLDDLDDESQGEADQAGAPVGQVADHSVPESSAPESRGWASSGWAPSAWASSVPTDSGRDPAPAAAAGDAPVDDNAASDRAAVADAPASSTPVSGTPVSGRPAAEPAVPAATGTEREPAPAEQETGDADGERPPAGQADPVQAAGMVAVLRGVPRYHQPDCVLIRFMPEVDVRLLTAEQAKADGCTPCAACQPAE